MKREINLTLKCLSNLRLRNQFILLISILVLVLAGILSLWSWVHTYVLSQIFIHGSQSAFLRQSESQLHQLTTIYKNFFEELININANNLISYHRAYRKAKQQVLIHNLDIFDQYQMQYIGTTQIPNSLRSINQYGTNISYSFMCYSNITDYSNPITFIENVEIKLQEQIQAFGQMLYNGKLILQQNIYSYIHTGKSYNEYPCKNKGKGIYTYVPSQRIWYNALMNSYNETVAKQQWIFKFSSPFVSFTDQAQIMSIALPLLNDDLSFNGGIITNFQTNQNFSQLNNNVSQFNLVLLLSKNGTLLMHPYKINITQLPVYIYNESITGFNQTDWYEILNSNQNTTISSRYNSIYQQELIINYYYFETFELYVLILISETEFNQFITKFNLDFQNFLNYQQLLIFCQIVILLFISYIFILISTYLIFYPINRIISKIMKILSKQNIKNKNLIEPIQFHLFQSKDLKQLQRSCNHLYQLVNFASLQKNIECQKLESIKYPQRFLNQQYQQVLNVIKIQKILNMNKFHKLITKPSVNELIMFSSQKKQFDFFYIN